MAKVYIFSTLTCDQKYTIYGQGGADVQPVIGSVLIKGGAGVANRSIVTPLGVMTEIDDSELELIEQNTDFQLHKKNGFITIEKKDADANKVAEDMARKDGSAPVTPNDYLVKDQEAPVVNKTSKA